MTHQRKEELAEGVNGRWACEECGARFDREKSGNRPIRFCSQYCYHAKARREKSYKGVFSEGNRPWNKGLNGIHISPNSEWKKGRRSENSVPVGTETIRTDKNGKSRCHVKVSEPSVWKLRAVAVWEKENNGNVPIGYVVHHIDRNSLNDDPSNLQAMTRAEHIEEHRSELRFVEPPKPAKQESLL